MSYKFSTDLSCPQNKFKSYIYNRYSKEITVKPEIVRLLKNEIQYQDFTKTKDGQTIAVPVDQDILNKA